MGYRDLTDEILSIVQFRWPEECCRHLSRLVTQDEIRNVLFSMKNGKAPSPDGFSVDFFKSTWTIVG